MVALFAAITNVGSQRGHEQPSLQGTTSSSLSVFGREAPAMSITCVRDSPRSSLPSSRRPAIRAMSLARVLLSGLLWMSTEKLMKRAADTCPTCLVGPTGMLRLKMAGRCPATVRIAAFFPMVFSWFFLGTSTIFLRDAHLMHLSWTTNKYNHILSCLSTIK